MKQPRLDLLVKETGSPYACVVLAAKRARQLTAHHQQVEEDLQHFLPPQVEADGNPITIALNEIATGKLRASKS